MASEQTSSLFIGFGGSGGKTLTSLANLISGNGHLNTRIARDSAFMLIDTDESDLATNKAAIDAAIGGVHANRRDNPIVKTVAMAEGVDQIARQINREINRSERMKSAPEELEALDRHWWFEGPKDDWSKRVPFTARLLPHSPREGAGAVPLVSQFLAWHRANMLAEAVREVVRELQNRALGGAQFRVKSYFVAGLSGGTGRGCWTTLGFALSRALSEFGINVLPTAFLFDHSIFHGVKGSLTAGSWLKQRVNSLTGISELVMWLQNDLRASRDFALPSLAAPLTQTAYCTTDLTGGAAELSGRSPCMNAWLIFGGTVNGVLPDPGSYYDMVGASLYARMVEAQIEGREINDKQPSRFIGSIGCNRVEVDAHAIGSAIENAARYLWLTRMISRRAERQQPVLEQFRKQADLKLDSFQRMEFGGGTSVDKPLAQRIWDEVRREINLGPLKNALEGQDLELAMQQAERLRGGLGSAECASAVSRAVGQPIVDLIKSLSDRMTGREDGLTIGDCEEILRAAKTELEEDLKPLQRRLAASTPDSGIPDPASEIRRVSGRRYLVGRRFDEDEITDVLESARRYLTLASFGAVKNATTKAFESMIATIDAALSRVQPVLGALEKTQADLRKTVHETCPAIAREAGFKGESNSASVVLADPTDWQQVLGARGGEVRIFDPLRAVRTSLRPAFGAGDIEEFCKTAVFDADFDKTIAELLDWIRGSAVLDAAAKTALTKSQEATLGRETAGKVREALDRVHASRRAMRDLGLADVVRRNVACLASLANEIRSRKRDHDHLLKAFHAVFNTPLPIDSDGYASEPPLAEVLKGLAINLAAKCDPYAIVERRSGDVRRDSAHLVLPAGTQFTPEFAQAVREDLRREITGIKQDQLTVARQPEHLADDERNPFLMLAYVSDSYDLERDGRGDGESAKRLASIDYWQNDARLRKELEACEDPDGASVFATRGDAFGMGYMNPTFVRDEAWAELRWRPWYEQSKAKLRAEETRHRIEDAILFMVAASSDTGHAKADQIAREARSVGEPSLEPPLLRLEGNKFSFVRRPVVRKGKQRAFGDSIPQKLLNSRDGIVKFRRRLAQDENLLAEIEAERSLFDAALVEAGITDPVRKAIRKSLHDRIDALRTEAEGQGGEDHADRLRILTAIRDRAQQFAIGKA